MANPTSIPADAKSVCTISVEVRDRDGNLVPDGTEVRFTATLGVIEEIGQTSAGVARVKLVSSDIAGESVITATWLEGQAVSQTSVLFGDAPVELQGPRYIEIEADEYLAYSVDYKIVEALGKVRIRHRAMVLEADEAQVNLERGRIIARSRSRDEPIKVTANDHVFEADLLVCDITTFRGLLLSVGGGKAVEVDLLRSSSGAAGAGGTYMPEELEFADLSNSGVLIKAREATVFPNEKIQFKRANVYVDGKRMLSLPLYVLSLTGYQAEEQYVGYSTGGLTLNLPMYYSLTPSSSGAFLIRHGESSGWGWYGQKPGWFLDMRQKYSTSTSQGTVRLSQITRKDWGAHISHSQRLGQRTQGYLYVDYAAHQDLYGMLNLNRSMDKFNMSLNLYGSRFAEGEDSMTSEFHLQTQAKRLGKLPLRYTLSSRTTYSTGYGLNGERLTESLYGNMHSSPIKLSRNLSLRGSLGLGYLWGSERISGLSTLVTAVADWKLSKHSRMGLSYRFADRASVYRGPVGRQSLSANWRLSDGKKWRASLFFIKGLDYPVMNILGDFSYYISKDWRVGVRSTVNEFGDLSYNDTELALGRRLGTRELMVVWSKSEGKLMLELGSAGF